MIKKVNDNNIACKQDEACSGNPGPGGWGAILMYKNAKKEIETGMIFVRFFSI